MKIRSLSITSLKTNTTYILSLINDMQIYNISVFSKKPFENYILSCLDTFLDQLLYGNLDVSGY